MNHPLVEILENRIAPAVAIATFVTNLSDSGTGSLRAAITAIDASSIGGTIGFNPHITGTITLKSALPSITNNLTLTAQGITINGGGKLQDLSITGGSSVSITGLTLEKGFAENGAGLYIKDSGGTVTLTSCLIKGNHAVGANGNASGGTNAVGGGISCVDGSLVIQNSTIKGNSALGGAGGRGSAGGEAFGGGISDNTGSNLLIISSVISGNTAQGGKGGAGVNFSASTAATSGGEGGYTTGGGIFTTEVAVTIKDSVITGNAAKAGSGGRGGKASPTGTGTYGGLGNAAYGGGIASAGDSLTIQTSTISGNIAVSGNGAAGSKGSSHGASGYEGGSSEAGGGGIDSFEQSLVVQGSTVSGNAAVAGKASGRLASQQGTSVGAGIYSQSGEMALSLVTVAKNRAGNQGGGVWVNGDATATIHNCTIAENSASAGGGIFTNGTVDVVSTIIGMNTAKTDADVDGAIDSSHDLIQNEGADSGSITSTDDITGHSPLLGALGYHDGGITETMLPSATSLAVTGGPGLNVDSLTADQNGEPFGLSVDIGAVQLQPVIHA